MVAPKADPFFSYRRSFDPNSLPEDRFVKYFCDGCRQLGYWMQELIACGDDPSPRDGYLLFHSLFQHIDEFIRLCLTTEAPVANLMLLQSIPYLWRASVVDIEHSSNLYVSAPLGTKFTRQRSHDKIANEAWAVNMPVVTMSLVRHWKAYATMVRKGQVRHSPNEEGVRQLIDFAVELSGLEANIPGFFTSSLYKACPIFHAPLAASNTGLNANTSKGSLCCFILALFFLSVLVGILCSLFVSEGASVATRAALLCTGVACCVAAAASMTAWRWLLNNTLATIWSALAAQLCVPLAAVAAPLNDLMSPGATTSDGSHDMTVEKSSDKSVTFSSRLRRAADEFSLSQPNSRSASASGLQALTLSSQSLINSSVFLGITAPCGIVRSNVAISFWGPVLAKATGFTPEETFGCQLSSVVRPHSIKMLTVALSELVKDTHSRQDDAAVDVVLEFISRNQDSKKKRVMASLTCRRSGERRRHDDAHSFVLMGRLWSEEETSAACHLARHAAELMIEHRNDIAASSITGQLMSMRAIVERCIGQWERMDAALTRRNVYVAAVGRHGDVASVEVEVDSGFRSEVYADASGMRRVVRAVADKLRGEALSSNGARLMINAELVTVIDGGHSGTQSVGLPKIVLTFRPGLGDSGSGKGFGAGAVEAVVAEVHSEKLRLFGALVDASPSCITIILPAAFESLSARSNDFDSQAANPILNLATSTLLLEQDLDFSNESPSGEGERALAEVQVLVFERDVIHRNQLLAAIEEVDPSCTPQTFSSEKELISAYSSIVNMACVFFPEDSDREVMARVRAVAAQRPNTVLVLTRLRDSVGTARTLFAATSSADGGRVVSLDLPSIPADLIHIINNTIHQFRDRFRVAYELLENKYERRDVIGSGAQATVYHAIHKSTGIEYAIKEVNCRADGAMAAAVKETKVLALLKKHKHPNIIRLEAQADDSSLDKYSFVLEYCQHGNFSKLLQILERSGGMEISLIAHFAKQLLSAVSCIHQCGIVHRDIKTLNLFLNGLGELKVGDFGISCFDTEPERWSCTPEYSPPEMARPSSTNTSSNTMPNSIGGSVNPPSVMSQSSASRCSVPQGSQSQTSGPSTHPSSVKLRAADLWMCGVCVFELFCWKPDVPNDPARRYNYFNKEVIDADAFIRRSLPLFLDNGVPSEVLPNDAEDFLRGLLEFDFTRRKSADEMMKHPFLLRASSGTLEIFLERVKRCLTNGVGGVSVVRTRRPETRRSGSTTGSAHGVSANRLPTPGFPYLHPPPFNNAPLQGSYVANPFLIITQSQLLMDPPAPYSRNVFDAPQQQVVRPPDTYYSEVVAESSSDTLTAAETPQDCALEDV